MLVWLFASLAHAMCFEDGIAYAECPMHVRAVEQPAPWRAVERTVQAAVVDGDRLDLVITWTLELRDDALHTFGLVGDTVTVDVVTVDGRPAAVSDDRRDLRIAGRGTRRVVLHGSQPLGAPATWLAAASGWVTVDAPGRTVRVEGEQVAAAARDGRWWAPWSIVRVDAIPDAVAQASGALDARVATGLVVDDASVHARSWVSLSPRQGRARGVRLAVPPRSDLAIRVPAGGTVRREGGVAEILLDRPTRSAFRVELSWTQDLPGDVDATVAIDQVDVIGSGAVERTTLVAVDTDRFLQTAWQGGAEVPARTLGGDVQALVDGRVLSAHTGHTALALQLTAADLLPAPPVVVDVADWFVACSHDGRVLMTGTLTLRNERAPAITLSLPPGHALLAAEVGGSLVSASRVEGGWRIPLPRSVDSVQGPIAFPVTLSVLGDTGRPFVHDDARDLALPVLDAPVAVRRVTTYLPKGAENRAAVGEAGVVADFDAGDTLAYGFGAGVDAARADALWQQAVNAYQDNDLSAAQARLDELKALGADNDNVGRLQDTLDVLDKGGGDAADAQVAKVRAQVDARAARLEEEQQRKVAEATALEFSGDAEAASAVRRDAAKLTGRIAVSNAQRAAAQADLDGLFGDTVEIAAEKRVELAADEEAREEAPMAGPVIVRPDPSSAPSVAAEKRAFEAAGAKREARVLRFAAPQELAFAPKPSPEPSAGPPPPAPASADADGDGPPGLIVLREQSVVRDVPGWKRRMLTPEGAEEAAAEDDADPDAHRYDGAAIADPARRTTRYAWSGGGVSGGSAGMAMSGVAGGMAVSEHTVGGQVLTKDELTRIPSGRSYQASVSVRRGVRRVRRGRGRAALPLRMLAPPPPPPIAVEVHAVRAGVVIPQQGVPVRHQHLLLPAGASVPVHLIVRLPRSS